MTKKQFNAMVEKYISMKAEMETMKATIEEYMIENSTKDEVVKAMPDGKELAVTYSDGYIQNRLDTKKAKQMFEELGVKAPITEITVSKKLDIKVRAIKSK